VKLVRALIAAAAALTIGVTVQVATSPSASASDHGSKSQEHQLCWTCWNYGGDHE
jgi:hypothetical protein